MNINIKRILKDINDLDKHNLNSHGIYHKTFEDDIYKLKVLMIGPSDTPYENGFYFFDITIPKNYPFTPPKVIYCTQNGKTRFNPNLYVSGKVCLSILNTWSGPQWTSCNSLTTVLLSIQSLVFVKNPLQNEPGFEKETGAQNKTYNNLILYENFNTAIYQMLENIPSSFEYFQSLLTQLFVENYENIKKNIENLMINDKKVYRCNFYNMKSQANYGELKDLLTIKYNEIIELNKL